MRPTRDSVAAPMASRVFSVVGMFWVGLGVGLNEWTLTAALGINPLGPRSLMFIRMLDLAAISWGLCTIRFRTRNLVQGLNLLVWATILGLTLVEGTLRAFPTILGAEFANGILNKYHTGAGGIYYADPGLRMRFMIPNFRTEHMYYSGYAWTHQTDRFGFRNFKTVTNADVVLLGDSFIYGHGVGIDQTVGFFLEKLTGYSVFNLARQGDCSFQEAYLLTDYLQRFESPRYVLYFYFENDIADLAGVRTDQELMEFINTPLAEMKYPERVDINAALRARDEQNYLATHVGSLYTLLKQRILLLRIPDWMGFLQNHRRAAETVPDPDHDPDNEESIGWRYTLKAITYMNYISQLHGARFLIVPITPSNKRHYAILKRFALEQNLEFIDTEAIDRSNQSLFLPRDGHFSGHGARTMAELVAEQLTRAAVSAPTR